MTSPANQNRQSQLAASKLGARLWRINVGLGWVGNAKQFKTTETVTVNPGDVVIRQARPFRSGIPGMLDGGGLVPVRVTQDMVGQMVAVSLWIEDKQGSGRASPEQSSFIKAIRALGGRAGIARNNEDVAAIVRGELRD